MFKLAVSSTLFLAVSMIPMCAAGIDGGSANELTKNSWEDIMRDFPSGGGVNTSCIPYDGQDIEINGGAADMTLQYLDLGDSGLGDAMYVGVRRFASDEIPAGAIVTCAIKTCSGNTKPNVQVQTLLFESQGNGTIDFGERSCYSAVSHQFLFDSVQNHGILVFATAIKGKVTVECKSPDLPIPSNEPPPPTGRGCGWFRWLFGLAEEPKTPVGTSTSESSEDHKRLLDTVLEDTPVTEYNITYAETLFDYDDKEITINGGSQTFNLPLGQEPFEGVEVYGTIIRIASNVPKGAAVVCGVTSCTAGVDNVLVTMFLFESESVSTGDIGQACIMAVGHVFVTPAEPTLVVLSFNKTSVDIECTSSDTEVTVPPTTKPPPTKKPRCGWYGWFFGN